MCAVNSQRMETKEEQQKKPFVEVGFFEAVKEGESVTSLVVFFKTSIVEGEAQQCNKLVNTLSVGSYLESLLCSCTCSFNERIVKNISLSFPFSLL